MPTEPLTNLEWLPGELLSGLECSKFWLVFTYEISDSTYTKLQLHNETFPLFIQNAVTYILCCNTHLLHGTHEERFWWLPNYLGLQPCGILQFREQDWLLRQLGNSVCTCNKALYRGVETLPFRYTTVEGTGFDLPFKRYATIEGTGFDMWAAIRSELYISPEIVPVFLCT